MAKMMSTWIHGQAATPESQPAEFRIWGDGAIFTIAPGSDLWVHVALPTPVIVQDKRASLHAVHYLFATSDKNSVLQNIHIRDGEMGISQQDLPLGAGRYGKHNTQLDGDNGTQVDWDRLQWGIGLSLRFVNEQGAGRFWLTGAGADYYVDL